MPPKTMTTKTKTDQSAFGRLAVLRAAARVAEAHAADREAQARSADRIYAAAAGKLASYYSGLEMGDQVDPEREQELLAAVRALDSRMVMRTVTQRGHTRQVHQDAEAEARRDGARAAAQDAQDAVGLFVREAREDLQAELGVMALEARDRLEAAIGEFSDAVGGWQRVAATWREHLPFWNPELMAELPMTPVPGDAVGDATLVILQVRGGARDPRGMIPMPSSLAPGAESEEHHRTPLRGWAHNPRIALPAGFGTGTEPGAPAQGSSVSRLAKAVGGGSLP